MEHMWSRPLAMRHMFAGQALLIGLRRGGMMPAAAAAVLHQGGVWCVAQRQVMMAVEVCVLVGVALTGARAGWCPVWTLLLQREEAVS